MTLEYSKKVMENFLHPKNMGKIENADGIGKVGNPVCLLPEEKIHKNFDMIKISKVSKEEKVLSHTGNYEEITGSFTRDYKGKVITLKNKLGKVTLTPEHLIYALIIPRGDKFKRNPGKRKLIPAWHHAENLKKGDIILYPILKEERDINELEINIQKPKYDFKSKEIPNKVLLDKNLLRLFGYFLAEGNIQDQPCKTYISFSLNIKEKDIVEDIKNISKRLFGLDLKIKEKPKNKTIVVYLYSAKLSRWFKSLFGNGAEHKKLPGFIMNLPVEKQKSIIFGLWKGDGYINIKRIGARAGFVTISYQLAQQMKMLLLRQKIVPSIYEETEKEIDGVKHKKSYRIHVGQRDSLIRLCQIMGVNYKPKSYESVKSWFGKDYLYTPITNKGIADYSGKVHNLEVNNSHSFVSEAFCLHNCGDIMYVYIKVGKKKVKGKQVEYIKDIKFQTLGCTAAIATSSMITQLAKNKTLGEAEKITRNDVASSLKGLPPIKMHCSNLAADALKLAIKDFLSHQKCKFLNAQKTHKRFSWRKKQSKSVKNKF